MIMICVANKMTICFHIDDCKLSHVKVKLVDKMIEHLRQEYKSISEGRSRAMMVRCGKVSLQIKLTMLEYIKEILNAWEKAEPDDAGTKSTEKIFTIDDNCMELSVTKTVQFHMLWPRCCMQRKERNQIHIQLLRF